LDSRAQEADIQLKNPWTQLEDRTFSLTLPPDERSTGMSTSRLASAVLALALFATPSDGGGTADSQPPTSHRPAAEHRAARSTTAIRTPPGGVPPPAHNGCSSTSAEPPASPVSTLRLRRSRPYAPNPRHPGQLRRRRVRHSRRDEAYRFTPAPATRSRSSSGRRVTRFVRVQFAGAGEIGELAVTRPSWPARTWPGQDNDRQRVAQTYVAGNTNDADQKHLLGEHEQRLPAVAGR